MAINWFEGGRRITFLLQAIVALGGIAYVLLDGSGREAVFETRNPDQNFQLTFEPCRYPDISRALDLAGTTRSNPPVLLCFREAPQGGGIMYRFAREDPEQPVAPPPTYDPEGPPPLVRTARMNRYYYVLPSYDVRVMNYIDRRIDRFREAGTYQEVVDNYATQIWVRAYWARVKEALPWVVGFIIGIALVTSVLGWIIRGFAGIPSGKDFRSSPNDN